MNRISAVLSVGALLGSLAVAVPHAVAAPAPHPVRATAGGPAPFVLNGTHPTDERRAVAPAAVPANPRLHPAALEQRPSGNGSVRLIVDGDRAAIARAVHAGGGRVLAAAGGSASVVVPRAAVAPLASAPGVRAVDAVTAPVEESLSPGASQAVSASGASAWHTAGQTGTGIRIGIVDDSFGVSQAEYDNEVNAGHLGTSPQLRNEDCVDDNNVSTPFDFGSHGLAVAELAIQQAPDAQLYLYCVGSRAGVAQAELKMEQDGVTIASSSLGWFADARGDGSGPAGSVATTVQRARQHGILWFNSAGNEVPQHYGGSLADANHDGVIDIGNRSPDTFPFESNFYTAAPGSPSAPTSLIWQYQWDAWPATTDRAVLTAYGVQCTAPDGSGGTDDCQGSYLGSVTATNSSSAHTPTLAVSTDKYPNTSGYQQVWQIQVSYVGKRFPVGHHYDLFGLGDTYFASALSCPTADTQNRCVFSVAARAQSLASPANSPYAVAVGAVNVGADGESPYGALEPFSSQGPTVDGRTKPELLGWDGVSSYVPEFRTGFYGTSAASPIVAGSAALVAGALGSHPDPAQILDILERRAQSGHPNTPPNNAAGYGALTLGSPATVAVPAGARYQAVTPTRIVDTRTGKGARPGLVGPGGIISFAVPGLPSDATAVAVNITGVGASTSTYLSAYPAGTAWPGTSNLNLKPKPDAIAAVFAVVGVRGGKVSIRNANGSVHVLVDELGYFGTGAEPGLYTSLATPTRVANNVPLGPGQSRVVDPHLPAGATAAVVNVTTANTTSTGFVSAAPQCSTATSTLNFSLYPRANLTVVPLTSAGTFCVANGRTTAHLYLDVVGYMGATGAQYVALPAAQRIIDTRTGTGGLAHGRPFTGGSPLAFYASGVGLVPASATALLTGVVETSNTAGRYLTVYPGATRPATSTLNYTPGRVVANADLVGVSAHAFSVYASDGSTNAAVDLFGYFRP